MILSKGFPLHTIEIWFPKYSTNSVLVACYKVKVHNKIVFIKAKHLEGYQYYLSGEEAKKHPMVTNGTVSCYEVPMDKLEQLEFKEDINRQIVDTANKVFNF